MNPLLDSARAKLGRAYHHLERLESEIIPFLESKPYRIAIESDTKTRKQTHRIHFEPFPSVQWSLIVGDCAHNARSALDHAVWGLAFQFNPTGVYKDTRTAFPVFETREKWRHKDSGQKMIRRLSPRPQALAKWLQPYRRSDPRHDPLAILHGIDIEDKHRVLTLTVISIQSGKYSLPTGVETELHSFVIGGPLEDGATIMEVTVREGQNPEDVKMKAEPVLEIAFQNIVDPGNNLPMPVLRGLRWMLACVGGVIDLFDRFAVEERSSHLDLPPSKV